MPETDRYLARQVDRRMVEIIDRELAGHAVVVDVACGRGQYGEHLARHATTVLGIDGDPALCDAARATGHYAQVWCDDVVRLADHVPSADGLFCSEFLEHVPNDRIRAVVATLERVAGRTIVVTVPNPRSPHFRHDPTHVLRYTPRSMAALLGSSTSFRWSMRAIGFAQPLLEQVPVLRALQPLAARIPDLSPTLLFVGHRR